MNKKAVNGKGNGTIPTTGFPYLKVDKGDNLTISYVINGMTQSRQYSEGEFMIVPANISQVNVQAFSNSEWAITQGSLVPAFNQSELQMSTTESRKLVITGDEEMQWLGRSIDLSKVSIQDLRITSDTLAQLFSKATATKNTNDIGYYLKMKQELIKIFY
ncbi:hypothetical protein [Priestia sp. GS2]|uniref:hypothetical protein n=1 Tax=Priestia sp. GS2 TaxID=3117403 RepID=UPI002ED9F10F